MSPAPTLALQPALHTNRSTRIRLPGVRQIVSVPCPRAIALTLGLLAAQRMDITRIGRPGLAVEMTAHHHLLRIRLWTVANRRRPPGVPRTRNHLIVGITGRLTRILGRKPIARAMVAQIDASNGPPTHEAPIA